MKVKKYSPTLYVYAPNRKTLYGTIPQPIHLKINYRFNTFSEMTFEIKKFYYNSHKGEWVKNPLYDKITKNNLIKIPNDNPVFKYKIGELYDDEEYDISRLANGQPDYDSQPNKVSTAQNTVSALRYTPIISHCTLQNEVELFDVGSYAGYGWKWYGKINSGLDENGDISPQSGGYTEKTSDIADIMNESFFPVEVGDIIAMGCQINSNGFFQKGANHYQYAFCPFFYENSSSNSCVHIGIRSTTENNDTNYYSMPIGRWKVKDGHLGGDTFTINGTSHTTYNKEGYVRFKGKDIADHSGGFWFTPGANRIKIFSGERRCKNIYTKNDVILSHGIPWWVINYVEEKNDTINPSKIVTAYSYEYTLGNRTFSVDADTLPLYIPDNIPKLVCSDEFPIDKWDGTVYHGAQRMKRGLLNQILDNLSGWKIHYISSGVCTRYRQIDEVDNANIYTYLMNTVQKLYQCYIVFDVENMYINVISQSDMISNISESHVLLMDRNAIKSFNVKDIDDNYATALKVHSEEDTYNLGLVNPNGTNIIYNFQNVLDQLDYVADENHLNGSVPYTLKELVTLYMNGIKSTSSYYTNYRSNAKSLIENNMKVISYKIKLSESLTEYRKEVDKNNILVKSKYEVDKVKPSGSQLGWDSPDEAPEVPPDPSQFSVSRKWSYSPNVTSDHWHLESVGSSTTVRDCWASRQNFDLIRKSAENYWDAYDSYVECKNELAEAIYLMKQIAMRFSLNINTLNEQYKNNQTNDGVPTSNYIPIFTPKEALELYKYIYESDWTNENVVFNEEYSSDDIYNTLVDLYSTANTEMEKIYSKPTLDFESDIANITRIPKMGKHCDRLFLGSSVYMFNDGKWVEPILLELEINYDDYDSSPMVFTTDYNRKPKEMRFYELFSTIQQTSVETPTYTFDN